VAKGIGVLELVMAWYGAVLWVQLQEPEDLQCLQVAMEKVIQARPWTSQVVNWESDHPSQ